MLDDIDALEPSVQAKLLRVLDERAFEPLGSDRTEPMRARVLVATNRALATTTVRATGRATGGNLAIDLAPRSDAWGGPVLDRRGHAIGVLTGDAPSAGAGEPTSFAVPIDRVKAVLRSVPRTGVVAGPMVIER